MKQVDTNINGLFIIKNDVFTDQRGIFMETWNHKNFKKHQLNAIFTKSNISISKKNTIRGLHFQNNPYGQLKYVNVLYGKVLDVVVDIRKKSNTFGEVFSIELSDINRYGLWIPAGCAHGFLSLQNNTIFSYKCTGEYKPSQEHTLKWDDKDLSIKWGIINPIISKKDNNGISFKEYIESKEINA